MKCYYCSKEAVAFKVVDVRLYGMTWVPSKIKALCKEHFEG